LPLKCAVVSLYSVVKQRLKCNTGKVCNRLIQFLLTMFRSVEERVFISAQRLSERTVVTLSLYNDTTARGGPRPLQEFPPSFPVEADCCSISTPQLCYIFLQSIFPAQFWSPCGALSSTVVTHVACLISSPVISEHNSNVHREEGTIGNGKGNVHHTGHKGPEED
jgi:hypothetical protein